MGESRGATAYPARPLANVGYLCVKHGFMINIEPIKKTSFGVRGKKIKKFNATSVRNPLETPNSDDRGRHRVRDQGQWNANACTLAQVHSTVGTNPRCSESEKNLNPTSSPSLLHLVVSGAVSVGGMTDGGNDVSLNYRVAPPTLLRGIRYVEPGAGTFWVSRLRLFNSFF